VNHFVQRLIMDGDGFRQNGVMSVNWSYAVDLRGKTRGAFCVCDTQQQKNGKRQVVAERDKKLCKDYTKRGRVIR
jgi:hypothetical protein